MDSADNKWFGCNAEDLLFINTKASYEDGEVDTIILGIYTNKASAQLALATAVSEELAIYKELGRLLPEEIWSDKLECHLSNFDENVYSQFLVSEMESS